MFRRLVSSSMHVVVGVGGGIAAYKTAELVSHLARQGHEVQVVMTEAAAEFIAPLTFSALSGRPVLKGFEPAPLGALAHVELSHWADALVIAPATADLMARLQAGRGDDWLTLIYLGFRGPCLLAPAMEPEMWEHPAVQRNRDKLLGDGVAILGPFTGRMASGRFGTGRMAEPDDLIERLYDLASPQHLAGCDLLVTAGPTWEHFDPVRVLTNPSTGRMGIEIVRQARRRGARVHLVAGPRVLFGDERWLDGVDLIPVVSAEEMLAAALGVLPKANAVVATAAVSDFRPRDPLAHKGKKAELGLCWAMERTPDVLLTLSQNRRPGTIIVGFAAETEAVEEGARAKREAKGLDWVVANRVGPDAGFGTLPYEATVIGPGGVEVVLTDKAAVARAVLDRIHWRRSGRV